MTDWTDDELRELEDPDNWDWDSAEAKPGRGAQLRQFWRDTITWSDNIRMTSLRRVQ